MLKKSCHFSKEPLMEMLATMLLIMMFRPSITVLIMWLAMMMKLIMIMWPVRYYQQTGSSCLYFLRVFFFCNEFSYNLVYSRRNAAYYKRISLKCLVFFCYFCQDGHTRRLSKIETGKFFLVWPRLLCKINTTRTNPVPITTLVVT